MVKTQITKQIFGVPSLETASRIDTHDQACRAQAAAYRCTTRLHELEAQFEAKASEIPRRTSRSWRRFSDWNEAPPGQCTATGWET
jgi:hypothetical protein